MGPKPKHEDVIATLDGMNFEEVGVDFDPLSVAESGSSDFSFLVDGSDTPNDDDEVDAATQKKIEAQVKATLLPEYMDD